MVDYTALAARNRALAEQIHAPKARHAARRLLLRAAGALPLPDAPSDGKTILLIRPDHVGDVLLTAPAVQALAQAIPEARLVALVGPWSAGVISVYPEIDLTLTLPFPGFIRRPARTSPQPYWLAVRRARQLRRLHADAAIIFRPDHWWGGMLAALAGIPQRVGFDHPDVAPFLTQAIPLEAGHAVEHNMALVELWTGAVPPERVAVSYPVAEDDRVYIREKLTACSFPPGAPRVIIHPGSGTRIKQWPPKKWAQVADALSTRWATPIIFTGTESELGLVRAITGQMTAPGIALAGETSIGQLAALLEDAHVVLGPDSGPLHLAAAVGAPTVHLYGPADPVEFGPWGDPARHIVLTTSIACRPCRVLDWPDDDPANHPCVRDIPVPDVIDAAQRAASA